MTETFLRPPAICTSLTLNILFQDLIIEVIYAGALTGKLDQKNQQLEVDSAVGRDIREEQVDGVVSFLENWCVKFCRCTFRNNLSKRSQLLSKKVEHKG